MATRDYVAIGKAAIVDLLQTEHAATWAEAQAKIGDSRWPGAPARVDPHHLTTARRELFLERRIAETSERYRGRVIPVLHLSDLTRRRTAFRRAASRKRLVTYRFLRWATATTAHPEGLIGPAGEAVTHASLREAAPSGYLMVRADLGPVTRLLGAPVPGGPLDSATFLTVLRDGVPLPAILVPIEVKNVRHWIYPSSQELYQLLYKAARLQQDNPATLIAPVLVCRRRHFLTLQFSKALGFYAAETRRQYMLDDPTITPEALDEVRAVLGFEDLEIARGSDSGLLTVFADVLPRVAASVAERWSRYAPALVEHFNMLRADLSDRERADAYDSLREAMEDLGVEVTW